MRALIDKLSLLEKASLLSGANVWQTRELRRLGIPALRLSDGPHGVRKQLGAADHLGLNASEQATCFPTAATIANSWDPDLAEEIGAALGREAAEQSVHVLLGPGLNIKRSPLGGRNFEYFSEDPFLSGHLAAAYVRGIQSQGVAATPKHFAANSQELRRMANDSIVDERTLRELYLSAFEIVVREASPWAIMTSYNLVNGTYANENQHLLEQILRQEWGFDGLVVSDWGGGNDAVAGVRAGCTLEMPSPGFDSARQIVAAVQSGTLAEADVDRRVAELLTLVERVTASSSPAAAVDIAAQHALARRAAAESAVLLRNEGGILPLAQGTRIAVVGDFAQAPRYQGAGSSAVNPTRLVSALDAIPDSGLDLVRFAQGFRRDGVPDSALHSEALEAACEADVVLLYLGLPESAESEGLDREHLRLPEEQVHLLGELAAANPAVVVVLSAGGVVETPWIMDCAALVHGYLGGQAGAEGILDVLIGKVNPSGRLAETIPFRLEDTPNARYFPGHGRTSEYREGLFIGYRYYETAGTEVAFPFGFGLSYTEFTYDDLRVEDGVVTFTVRNEGKSDGAEVPQLYISRQETGRVYRPLKELRGFTKVRLAAGESTTVRIPLDTDAFRHFDAERGSWEVEPGSYDVLVGANVRDIRLSATYAVPGVVPGHEDRPPEAMPELEPYSTADVRDVSTSSFRALLGRHTPDGGWGEGLLDRNDPLVRLRTARSPIGRLAFRLLDRKRGRGEAAGAPDLNILFLFNMPFRAIAKMTNGVVTVEMVDGIVDFVNGRHFRGLRRIVGGFVRARLADRSIRHTLGRASDRRPDRRLDQGDGVL